MAGNLTRILNNQIQNSTIIASQKIAAGTITGTLFASNVTVPGDLLISGNLFVLGSSAYTTVASTNTYVNDPLIVLNNGLSSTNTYDEGLIFNRGSSQNRALIWSESGLEFRLIGTTETGTTYGTVGVSNYANLHLGNLTVDYAASIGSLSVSGALSGASLNVTGNVLASGGIFNALTVNGNETVTGYLNVTGNVISTGAIHNSLTVNGNETISGYINAAGNISTPQLNAGQINTTGNVLAATVGASYVTASTATLGNIAAVNFGNTGATFTGASINLSGNVLAAAGVLNALTVNGNETVTGYLNVTGNVLASTVGASFLTASTVAVGNIAAVNFGNTGAVFTGASINLSGNVLAAGAVLNNLAVNGNASLGLAGAVSGSWINVVGNITQTTAGGPVYINTTGNVSAAVGVFGAINSTGYINTSGNISTPQLNAGQINTTGNVDATAGIFNALTVNGNESVTGYLNVTGNVLGATGVFAGVNTTGYINAGGNISTPQLNAGQINTTGNVLATTAIVNALTVNGNETVTGYLNVTGNVLANVANVSILNATSGIIGNVTITNGNFTTLNVSGNALLGLTQAAAINNTVIGNATPAAGTFTVVNSTGNVLGQAATFSSAQINGNESVTGYLNVTGNILGSAGTLSTLVLNSSTNATGASTGALQVAGGASFGKDIYVVGNVYAANIIGTGYQYLSVVDPLLYLQGNVVYPYSQDIGFYSHFIGGPANIYAHTGLVRDFNDGYWKLFSNVAEPAGGVVTFDVNTVYDGLKLGNLVLTNTTSSTSTGTGALVVSGGAGIAGTVVAGQLNSTGNVLGQGAIFNAVTVNGNESVTGYLNVTGNILGATATVSALNVNGIINATGNVLGTAGTFNSLTVNGNESVTGYLNVTGNILGSTGTLSALNVNGVINATGNILGTAGTFNSLTVNGNESVTGYLNVTGNVLASTSIAQLHTGSTATFGNVAAVNFGNTGAYFTGASVNMSGNVLSTGLSVFGNTNLGLAGQVSGSWTNIVGNITQTTAGGPVYINTTGNVSAAVGVFGAINSTGYINTSGNISTPQLNAGQINTTGNVLGVNGVFSTVSVNGALTVNSLNASGNVLASTVGASFLTASTVAVGNISAVTIGNTGAVITGLTGAFAGNVIGGLAQFAAINATPIGNATASTGAFTTLTASAGIWANSATDTTSTSTGAIVVPNGGIAVSGNVYAGKNLYVGGASAFTTNLTNPTVVAIDTGATYAQMALINTTLTGSSDYIAYPGDYPGQSNDHGWADFGFAGTAFNDGNYSITRPHDSYFFGSGANTTVGGNLVLATDYTGLFNDIVFGVGSFLSTSEVLRFHGNVGTSGNAWLKYTTVSTTPTTGALRVDGGVGIVGNIRVGGGAVFNNSQLTDPFQVKGKATTTLIYADTAYGAVILGGSNTSTPLGSTVKINGTDTMLLPIGTTAQRPSNSGNVDLAGMLRFNSTVNNMEFYDGSQWQTAGSVFTVISDRQFAGNVAGGYGNVDGTNTTFTIQANSTTAATLVSINGISQFPTLAYSVSGATLTFTEPPAPNDVIDVRVLATTTVVSSITSGNGLNQFLTDATGSQIWTGSAVTTERVLVDNVGNFNFLSGNKVTYTQTAVNIPSTGTPTQIDTWSQTAYTTAKYVIQSKVGTTNFEAYEALVVTDGAGNAYVTTYGFVNNGTSFGTISAAVSAGNVVVSYSSSIAQANVKAQGTFIV